MWKARIGGFVSCLGWPDIAVAAPRQCFDPLSATRLAEFPADRRDLHREIAVLDGLSGPRGGDQYLLADRSTRLVEERREQRYRALAKRRWLCSLKQDRRVSTEPERAI